MPKLATGELIGCFGLTEPDAGSDPASMKTRAVKTDSGISGSKMWISNSPVADVFVVWAKSEHHDGKIKGFVLEKGRQRSQCAYLLSVTGEIVMDNVEVAEMLYYQMFQVLRVFGWARYGIAWGEHFVGIMMVI